MKEKVMQISSNIGSTNTSLGYEQGITKNSQSGMNLYTEKISAGDAKELRSQIVQSSNEYMFNSASIQSGFLSTNNQFTQDYNDFQSFLDDIGYEGNSIADLSKEEATELVSEDGFFGVTQTSERIANFVINGAGGDESLLRAGRQGMLEGFKMAEEMWGSELPEISQQTMQKATEMVDLAMNDLGFSILNKEV